MDKKPHEECNLTHDFEKIQGSQKEDTNQFSLGKDLIDQSSSSYSSYDSNVSNSSPVDALRPEEQMDSLFDYGEPFDVSNILQEVNKPDVDSVNEIPFEADVLPLFYQLHFFLTLLFLSTYKHFRSSFI